MNMITNTKHIYKFKPQEPAYLSKTDVPCEAGQSYPIYISRLMSGINFGDPEESLIHSKGTLCFRNAPGCRVYTNQIMKTQNFLDIPFERNNSWEGLTIELEDGTILIPQNTPVVCHCPDNSVSNMTFSNN